MGRLTGGLSADRALPLVELPRLVRDAELIVGYGPSRTSGGWLLAGDDVSRLVEGVPQRGVPAADRQQVAVGPLFGDPSFVDHDDPIGAARGLETVCDQQRGAA